jgi:hypothetical protein
LQIGFECFSEFFARQIAQLSRDPGQWCEIGVRRLFHARLQHDQRGMHYVF